jgi:hypothetical protein
MQGFARTHHITLCALLLATAPRAIAYGPCDSDTEKYCATDTHQETVKACLHKKIEQLAPDCKVFVKSQEEEYLKAVKSFEQVKTACATEIAKKCEAIAKEEDAKAKALQVCLMSESKDLRAPCKQDLNRHIREFQLNIKELP